MLRNYAFYCLVIIGAGIVLVNLIASQNLPTAYFNLTQGKIDAYSDLLRSIQQQPEYTKFYFLAKNMFGEQLDQYVYREKYTTKQDVTQMQELLKVNPYQKDILYNLYLLYQEQGNKKLAQEYFNKAQIIDPTIK